MAQHHFYQNGASFRIEWKKIVVRAKITNQKNLLIRYHRNQPVAGIDGAIATLQKSLDNLDEN